MKNWRQKFGSFMAGRYGSDPFNLFLLVSACLISFIFSFTKISFVGSIIAILLLIFNIFRAFSRNRVKRAAENYRFMKLWTPVNKAVFVPIGNFFSWVFLSIKFHKKNKYFLCPKCSRIACVPKGTGKVTITCKNCRRKYDRKA